MADELFLELRIHGVNNTKPQDTLGLDVNEVEMVAGDKLGSFWRPTPSGRAKSGIRKDIEREAYSWGEMARSSVGGSSSVSKIIGAVSRAGWALLLPFGLVNVAYWTRAVDDGPDGPAPTAQTRWWRKLLAWKGWGAATLRVAGLLITLLLAVTTSAIVLDLVAVQCFVGETKVCTALPSFLDFLSRMGQARRLALLSLVPVLLVLGLLGLSAATRVRYEQPDPEMKEPGNSAAPMGHEKVQDRKGDLTKPEVEASTATYNWPLLAVKGFWSHRSITKVTARLHVAATATVVAIATAVHFLFGFSSTCKDLNSAVNRGVGPIAFMAQCLPEAQTSPRATGEIAIIIIGVVVLILIIVSLIVRSDYAVDVQVSAGPGRTPKRVSVLIDWIPVVLAGLLFVAQLGILISADRGEDPTVRYLIGTSAAPAMILTALVVIGLSALLWRLAAGPLSRHAPNVIALLVIVLFGWMALDHSNSRRIGVTIAIAAMLIAIVLLRRKLIQDQGQAATMSAWNGSAPGIFLLLATLLAMLLSSAVATAAGNWLNSDNTAASLADGRQPNFPEPVDCVYSCSTELKAPNLEVALPYMWFGAICLPLLVIVLVGIGGVAAVRSFTWDGKSSENKADIRASVLQKRRSAAMAHRAERYVVWLVIAGTFGILASITVAAWGERPRFREDGKYSPLEGFEQYFIDFGMILLAGGGLLVVGLAVGGSMVGGVRPLGLAWDLMCFLPRSGHPLAPPCYAERAVPELVERCVVWLTTPEVTDETRRDRRIVLSAHSLGSVLAVAVLLSPRIVNKSQISLLTYGSQLRAYFSRIFPELLGPKVLGIQPCASSSLRTKDPWEDEIRIHPDAFDLTDTGGLQRIDMVKSGNDIAAPYPADKRSVSGVLSEGIKQLRWRNLWRRSDYLGFPVLSYANNPIDRVAEEVIRVDYLAELQTHSNYPKADAYWTAFVDLLPAEPQRPTPDTSAESMTQA